MALPDPPRKLSSRDLLARLTESFDVTMAALIDEMRGVRQESRDLRERIDRYHRDNTRERTVDRMLGPCTVAALVAAVVGLYWCARGAGPAAPPVQDAGAQAELVDAARAADMRLAPPPADDKKKRPKPTPPPRPVPDPDGDVTTDPQAGHHRGTMNRNAECRDTPTPRADCAPVPRGAQR